MKLLSLSVGHFRCIRKAKIEFGRGLNVLHGPNDLGKSSLAYAVRAALLLQHSSREHEEFLNWDGTGEPSVELVFESEAQRIWRVRKTFGDNSQAFLDESRNGTDFHIEARGRDVDGRLSEILRWGLAPPGGKGRPKGMPMTFLSTALLAEQDRVGAIFEQALANDSDESGKKQLVEALQAMAEDPLFKAVLGRVQDKVDQAFTGKGKKRLGKNSPWTQIRDLIRRAEEYERQCNLESQKTSALEIELQGLRAHHLECKAAVERAQGLLDEMEDSCRKGKLRQEILARLEQANGRLRDARKTLEDLAGVEQKHADCIRQLTRLGAQEESATIALTEANRQLQIATEEVARLQSEDRARERLLKEKSLEKRRAELRAAQVETKALLENIRHVELATETVHASEMELQQLTESADGLRKHHDSTLEAIRLGDEQERALRAVNHFLRYHEAHERIREAESGLAQITAWRNEAHRQRSVAASLENLQPSISLPSLAQLDGLRHLYQELEVARARLDVGLFITVQAKQALSVAILRDESDQSKHELGSSRLEVSASREIQLSIEGVADIAVSGGARDARKTFENLQARWTMEADPLLKQAEVENLNSLIQLADNAAKRSEEIQEALRITAQLEQRVADQPDWADILAIRQRELDEAERAFQKPEDRIEGETLARQLGITDATEVGRRLDRHQAEHNDIVQREKKVGGELIAVNTRIGDKRTALIEAQKELLRVESSVSGDWRTILKRELDHKNALEVELVTIDSEIQDLAAEQDKPVGKALEALGLIRQAALTCDSEYRTIEDQLRDAENCKASIEGELKARREAAAKVDEPGAKNAVKLLDAELQLAAAPVHDISESMLMEARERVQAAGEELKRIESEIQAKRGALQHVGGDVAKQRAEAASDALERAREEEHEMEIDYAAWELLRNTLRDAEQEEGAHLGKALGDPITKRFAELTDNRYGVISLGPDLETHGISAVGRDRSLSSLSVGTRDQLSTIFRLSLAEQLQSAVLLDDQLTQSDPERMAWLRKLIREVAGNIQVVVFTCRPEDYLLPDEIVSVNECGDGDVAIRSVDLLRVIESGRVARTQKSPRNSGPGAVLT